MNLEQNKLLTHMKNLIKQGKRKFQSRSDRNYIEDLLEIGISVEEAWNQILSLNVNYYVFDELPYYKKSSKTLLFKKNINGIYVYIKLKLEENDNDEIVVCLSFHRDKKEKKNYEMSKV